MDPIIYAVAAVLVAIVLWFVTREKAKDKPDAQPQAQPQPAPRQRDVPVGTRRRDVRARIHRRIAERQQQHDDGEDEEADSDVEVEAQSSQKIGTKKQKKLQGKEERRLAREAEQQERAEKKLAQEEREKMLKEKEKREMLEEQKQLEIERKLQEEKEKQEHEEYLKIKDTIEVEEVGQDVVESEDQSNNMLQEFLDYVKNAKVVLLEDLASHFGLRTQAAIDRIQDLLKEGVLTGVIDDRGKFIYITQEELEAVAEFVEQRGRVSISELAKASNSLINLKPEEELTLAS